MEASSPILTIGTFASAFVGAIIGIFLDRFWRRIELRPLFRIQFGFYGNVKGRGRLLSITNVGLDPLPEYNVQLFHHQRGSLGVFEGDQKELVFPQYPEQKNDFYCPTQPTEHCDCGMPSMLKDWFLRLRDKAVAAPSFVDFRLRLVMRNSDLILFEDEEMGNHIAKGLYEDAVGIEVEQDVKPVFYRSKAPFWVEMIRSYKTHRAFRRSEKAKQTKH